ncbi:DLA class I histocompatibility antigen, A9/A9 alpha chain-like [Corvus cornix cornix]|uniref:DLA class I histocompatibility antigen, A9/A9 alpha chain-like n=1 Tax=Corvus cornix cornix TaxID=932674 RepID=UPI001952931B|nr:DLA class I histocompatibility antigen, A9/A9 alpha chain-like [Corvus cornix cornix]
MVPGGCEFSERWSRALPPLLQLPAAAPPLPPSSSSSSRLSPIPPPPPPPPLPPPPLPSPSQPAGAAGMEPGQSNWGHTFGYWEQLRETGIMLQANWSNWEGLGACWRQLGYTGCEWSPHGAGGFQLRPPVQRSVHGSQRHGYDGWDFISFQLGSGSFAVSDGATRIPQRCWESKGILAEQMKHYLGHTCVEELPKYIRCGWEALEHKAIFCSGSSFSFSFCCL